MNLPPVQQTGQTAVATTATGGDNQNTEPNVAAGGSGETDTNAQASAAYNASVIASNKQIAAGNAKTAADKKTAFTNYITNVAGPAAAAQTERANTLSQSNAGGNGPAQFEGDLVTDGGFTPAQAAQLESIYNADLKNPTMSPAQIQIDLINSAPVKERYPAMAQMQAKGLAPISISNYQAVEQSLAAMGKATGLPPEALSAQDVTNVIVNNIPVSGGPDSIEGRLSQATQWAENVTAANPDAWTQLQSMYGVTKGSLTAFALNGDQGVVGNQLTSAQTQAEASGLGYSPISKTTLLAAAAAGMSASSAQSALAQSAPLTALEKPLAGSDANALQTVAPGTVAAAALGQATGAQQRDIVGAGEARAGAASGGGGFGATSRGSGVGSASEGGAKSDVMQ